MNFNRKPEDIIKKTIKAETTALNSPKGQEIMQKFLNKVKEENPNLTPDEWSKFKKELLISVFNELVKENSDSAKNNM